MHGGARVTDDRLVSPLPGPHLFLFLEANAKSIRSSLRDRCTIILAPARVDTLGNPI